MHATLAVALVTIASGVLAQGPTPPDTNSYPHDYPGKPAGDYSPAWQSCTFGFIGVVGFPSLRLR
jgi:carboxypeptidase D